MTFQVLVNVSVETFVNDLNHARRRFPLVDANVYHESELLLKVSKEFHAMRPVRTEHDKRLADVPFATDIHYISEV